MAGQSPVAGHTATQRLFLPDFPPPAIARTLSPNGRAHWGARSVARTKVYSVMVLAASVFDLQPIRCPVRVTFRYIRPTRGRVDIDNLTTGVTKACLDALVRGEWLEDDDSQHVVSVTAEVVYEKGRRALEIVLSPAPTTAAGVDREA